MVTIREDGIERRVNAAEAFLLHMAKRGLRAMVLPHALQWSL